VQSAFVQHPALGMQLVLPPTVHEVVLPVQV
jgi:hypothetical protein